MVEFIRHITGCCGEGHPSLLYIIGVPTFLILVKSYIIKTYKLFMLIVKSCLKRLY